MMKTPKLVVNDRVQLVRKIDHFDLHIPKGKTGTIVATHDPFWPLAAAVTVKWDDVAPVRGFEIANLLQFNATRFKKIRA
jgi:hypothetical protein